MEMKNWELEFKILRCWILRSGVCGLLVVLEYVVMWLMVDGDLIVGKIGCEFLNF